MTRDPAESINIHWRGTFECVQRDGSAYDNEVPGAAGRGRWGAGTLTLCRDPGGGGTDGKDDDDDDDSRLRVPVRCVFFVFLLLMCDRYVCSHSRPWQQRFLKSTKGIIRFS